MVIQGHSPAQPNVDTSSAPSQSTGQPPASGSIIPPAGAPVTALPPVNPLNNAQQPPAPQVPPPMGNTTPVPPTPSPQPNMQPSGQQLKVASTLLKRLQNLSGSTGVSAPVNADHQLKQAIAPAMLNAGVGAGVGALGNLGLGLYNGESSLEDLARRAGRGAAGGAATGALSSLGGNALSRYRQGAAPKQLMERSGITQKTVEPKTPPSPTQKPPVAKPVDVRGAQRVLDELMARQTSEGLPIAKRLPNLPVAERLPNLPVAERVVEQPVKQSPAVEFSGQRIIDALKARRSLSMPKVTKPLTVAEDVKPQVSPYTAQRLSASLDDQLRKYNTRNNFKLTTPEAVAEESAMAAAHRSTPTIKDDRARSTSPNNPRNLETPLERTSRAEKRDANLGDFLPGDRPDGQYKHSSALVSSFIARCEELGLKESQIEQVVKKAAAIDPLIAEEFTKCGFAFLAPALAAAGSALPWLAGHIGTAAKWVGRQFSRSPKPVAGALPAAASASASVPPVSNGITPPVVSAPVAGGNWPSMAGSATGPTSAAASAAKPGWLSRHGGTLANTGLMVGPMALMQMSEAGAQREQQRQIARSSELAQTAMNGPEGLAEFAAKHGLDPNSHAVLGEMMADPEFRSRLTDQGFAAQTLGQLKQFASMPGMDRTKLLGMIRNQSNPGAFLHEQPPAYAQQPESPVPEKMANEMPALIGLEQADSHPVLSKYFRGGKIHPIAIARASDADLAQAVSFLNPEARGMLRQHVANYTPNALEQRLGANHHKARIAAILEKAAVDTVALLGAAKMLHENGDITRVADTVRRFGQKAKAVYKAHTTQEPVLPQKTPEK